ncbi:tetratricopeptide repeat protein [Hydrogenophaga sp.]|uniref:tetratricopeptide repeat protein n=1 Tax=Hydrogenophaga sp. TaxID=1904254 RepID=UPI002727F016|nr:tetratricopeptide repeat protein [Hydrogenophaga sp.]MDO9436878.1 tetratricopeptide repeat protein [Hydrogenophaga sp.]
MMAAIATELKELAEALEPVKEVPPESVSLGQLRGLTAADYLTVYDAAEELCDQGRFQEAMPLALYLAGHEPRYTPFTFLAGSCLQRLGKYAAAAELYALSLDDGPNDGIAMFRIGECLEATQLRKEAGQAFEAALDNSRGNPNLWQLQDWAMNRALALKPAQENQHV